VCAAVGVPGPVAVLPQWTRAVLPPAVAGTRRVGVPLPIDAIRLRLSYEYLYADGSRAADAFGLRPTPFARALAPAVAWYRDTGRLPQPDVPAGAGGGDG